MIRRNTTLATLFSMAYFVTALKKRAIDPSITDEEFVRNLFTPYICAGNIKDKNRATLDLNKSRVSTLLSQKDDVPTAMRNALTSYGIFENTKDGFAVFVDDTLVPEQLPALIQEISSVVNSTPTIPAETRQLLSELENNMAEYLCTAFFEAIRQNNRVTQTTDDYLWHRGANSLQLIEGDLFKYGFGNRKKQPSIVVIPVNTSFDTHISWMAEGAEAPIVSPTTIHGQWIDRWMKAGNTVEQLNKQIEANLMRQKVTCTVDETQRTHYAIGSIAVVNSDNAIYYLLAISTFDEQNIAHSTENEIREAVLALLKFYNQYGNGYPLYLPLLGTGRSRAALGYQASFDLIREEMIRNNHLLQGQIMIVASKEAMDEIKTEVD